MAPQYIHDTLHLTIYLTINKNKYCLSCIKVNLIKYHIQSRIEPFVFPNNSFLTNFYYEIVEYIFEQFRHYEKFAVNICCSESVRKQRYFFTCQFINQSLFWSASSKVVLILGHFATNDTLLRRVRSFSLLSLR